MVPRVPTATPSVGDANAIPNKLALVSCSLSRDSEILPLANSRIVPPAPTIQARVGEDHATACSEAGEGELTTSQPASGMYPSTAPSSPTARARPFELKATDWRGLEFG